MALNLAPVAITAATNLQGVTTLQIFVPGVFGRLLATGVIDTSKVFGGANKFKTEGRFLKKLEIFSDNWVGGDRVTQIRLLDPNGLVPIQLRGPGHPIVFDLLEHVAPENPNVFRALWSPQTRPIEYILEEPMFLPAGLRLALQFQGGGIVAAGRIVRANVYWGNFGKGG